jgi:hypothetical protein
MNETEELVMGLLLAIAAAACLVTGAANLHNHPDQSNIWMLVTIGSGMALFVAGILAGGRRDNRPEGTADSGL